MMECFIYFSWLYLMKPGEEQIVFENGLDWQPKGNIYKHKIAYKIGRKKNERNQGHAVIKRVRKK